MNTDGKGKLAGKVAIITGGGKGIGRAIALGLSKEGANLVVCDIEPSHLPIVCQKARSMVVSAILVKADVSVESEVESMLGEALKVFGRVDVLVNNASLLVPSALITDVSKEVWDKVINTNITGMFLCSKAVVRHMIKNRMGNVINLSSDAGIGHAIGDTLPYIVSKFGIEGLTHALAKQLKQYGICVNAIRPGPHDTDMVKGIVMESWPQLRKPNRISKLAVFLALQTVETMTGKSIGLWEWEKDLRKR